VGESVRPRLLERARLRLWLKEETWREARLRRSVPDSRRLIVLIDEDASEEEHELVEDAEFLFGESLVPARRRQQKLARAFEHALSRYVVRA
jgi:hypothetical protein